MGNLACFFAGNAEKRENKKIVVSSRFKDEDGKTIPWEVRIISAEEDEKIRKECTKTVPVIGKKGQFREHFNSNEYLTKLTVKSIVSPDLNNKELQDSYRVMGAEALIKTMLYKDEFDKLTEKLLEDSEAEDINDLIDTAKN